MASPSVDIQPLAGPSGMADDQPDVNPPEAQDQTMHPGGGAPDAEPIIDEVLYPPLVLVGADRRCCKQIVIFVLILIAIPAIGLGIYILERAYSSKPDDNGNGENEVTHGYGTGTPLPPGTPVYVT